MNIWVGVTDEQWFDRLTLLKPDEVNFWQPSGGRKFAALAPGEPFLFKLHSPKNFIVSGGHVVRHSPLPASLAWDAFGEKNGVGSYRELLARVRRYRRQNDFVDTVIGCNVLAEPFFFVRDQWIPAPSSWAPDIVQGKTYDSTTTEDAALWREVRQSVAHHPDVAESTKEPLEAEVDRFGSEYLTRSRLG